jgi:phospholipase C
MLGRMLRRVEAAGSRRRITGPDGPDFTARPRPDREPGHDGLPQIRHIVILMMENHSYDNYLGTLGRGDGFTPGPDGQPQGSEPGPGGAPVPLHHLTSPVQVKSVPTQSWNASHVQWNNGQCDGFVRSIEVTEPGLDPGPVMGYFTERELPFYHGLASTFPVADRWFCSCLGPTFPNRRFLIAGTAHGLIDDLPFDLIDYPAAGTIFDLLTAHGIGWVNYHQLTPPRLLWQRLTHARGLRHLRVLSGLLLGLLPALLPGDLRKLQATSDLFPLGLLRSLNHLRPVQSFFRAAATGKLPPVSIVDPDFEYTSEENPRDVQAGEGFSAKVINAVLDSPAWPDTLLIWLYDEHGGYYDHVPPPAAVAPDDVPARDPMRRFWPLRLLRHTPLGVRISRLDDGPETYTRLGFRVPAVLVSPYARPDFVTSQVYDHTSVLKLIERKWNLPPLTRRDAAATDPLEALDLDGPPAFLTPPALPEPARPWTGRRGRGRA